MYSTAGGIGVRPYLASLDTIPAHKFLYPTFTFPAVSQIRFLLSSLQRDPSAFQLQLTLAVQKIFYQQEDSINPHVIF
jgi:hypothetical protein